ncbi:MAG: zinc ribbon domain-containing protein [Candidatus Jordarchaeaceae archaeon]
MSLRVGLVGCVVGSLTCVLGLAWSVMSSLTLEVFPQGLVTWWAGALRLYFQFTRFSLWFFWIFSFLFGVFLIISGIMVGVSLRSLYKLAGKRRGSINLVTGIIVPSVALVLMLISIPFRPNEGWRMESFSPPTPLPIVYEPSSRFFTYVLWVRPNDLYLGLSFVMLALLFTVFGANLYVIRFSTGNPSLSSTSGKISMIAGGLLLAAVIPQWGPLFFGSAAFVLVFVFYVILFMVYRSSLSLISKGKIELSLRIPSKEPAEKAAAPKFKSEIVEMEKKGAEKIFKKCPFCGADIKKGEPVCPKCGGVLI